MKFAFVFPGQGSQSVGMVKDLAESYSIVRESYQQASDVIKIDLWKLVQEGPSEELNQTRNTQPAMLAASYAISRIWSESTSSTPTVMAGHSFGEISAFTCANSMSFADACLLARRRGELMQNAVAAGSGAMAAILGLADDVLDELCKTNTTADAIVEAVNYNAPGQVVIAGHSSAVEKLIEVAKQEGAKRALKLPVSVPAHSSLMKPAAEQFTTAIADLAMQLPEIDIIQNATLTSPATVEDLRAALHAQLFSPVKWVDTIELIKAKDVNCVVEMGPGKVLSGLHKRIDKSLTAYCVSDNSTLEKALTSIEE